MKRLTTFAVISALLVTGCASGGGFGAKSYSGAVYKGAQAQRSQQVSTATIVGIRQITIQDDPQVAGATVGAGMGALAVLGLAGTGGNPYGLAAGAIAAGVLGGAATDYVSKKMLEQPGFEFTVKLNDGRIITVVQTNIDMMAVGDKVYLTQSADGTLRVYKL